MNVDLLPMIQLYTREGRGGAELLAEFRRRVGWVARPYPDIWFALGRKTDEAITDLTHRVFVACCTTTRPGFPYRGRTPFTAFVADEMDMPRITACCFTARWSLTREAMRADREHNIVRNPRARWEAEVFASVATVLEGCARSEQHHRRGPRTWFLPGVAAPAAAVADEWLIQRLREDAGDVQALAVKALTLAGPMSQRRLSSVVTAALGGPAPTRDEAIDAEDEHVDAEASPVDAAPDEASVRRVVQEAWARLSLEERELLGWVAQGLTGREIVQRRPELKHEVRVTRIKQRCEEAFMKHIVANLGGRVTDGMLDTILEVLAPTIELREVS